MNKTTWLTIGLILCAGAGAWLVRGPSAETAREASAAVRLDDGARARQSPVRERATVRVPSSQPDDGELAELAARVDHLEDSQGELWNELSAGDEPGDSPDAVIESVIALYDDRLATEPEDTSWRAEAEQLIARTISGEGFPGSDLTSIECRSTLCKLELRHTDGSGPEHYAQHFLESLPFPTAMFYHHIEDGGGTRTLSYVARPGHRLPVLD